MVGWLSHKSLWLVLGGVVAAVCLAYVLPAAHTGEPLNFPSEIGIPEQADVIEAPIAAEQYTSYQVAPDEPRYFSVPRLGVSARVVKARLTSDGHVGAPRSIHDVGWYVNSVKPGQAGVTFVDGHVSGPRQAGVFKRLGTLTRGDTVEIEKGDGTKLIYVVGESRLVLEKNVAMKTLLAPQDQTENTLVLMTCGGSFDRDDNRYNDRVIVTARLE